MDKETKMLLESIVARLDRLEGKTDCHTCEPEISMAHSMARFNEQAAQQAITSQQNFQQAMTNSWQLQQRELFPNQTKS